MFNNPQQLILQSVFAHLAKMDLDFVDGVSYLLRDGGA